MRRACTRETHYETNVLKYSDIQDDNDHKSTPKEKKQNKIKRSQGKIAHPRSDPCFKQA